MKKKACFRIYGPDGKIAERDVLDPKITGFPKEKISAISFIPHFMVTPYLEHGVAWNLGHPIHGSGSFRIEKDDGTTVIVSPIFFSDKNVLGSHFSGLAHWNIEFWWYKEGEKPRRVDEIPGTKVHQVGKSGFLEFVALGTGFKTYRTRMDWKA